MLCHRWESSILECGTWNVAKAIFPISQARTIALLLRRGEIVFTRKAGGCLEWFFQPASSKSRLSLTALSLTEIRIRKEVAFGGALKW